MYRLQTGQKMPHTIADKGLVQIPGCARKYRRIIIYLRADRTCIFASDRKTRKHGGGGGWGRMGEDGAQRHIKSKRDC